YKSFRHYHQLKINADGNQVVYSRNQLNQLRVYLKNLETGQETRLLKYGPKIEQMPDYSYPLLGWHPNRKIVAIIYERKDQLTIQMHDLESNEVVKRNLPNFEKINSFSFSDDGKKIAI